MHGEANQRDGCSRSIGHKELCPKDNQTAMGRIDDWNPICRWREVVGTVSKEAESSSQLHSIHNAHQYLKHNDFLKDKLCIIQIHNGDNLCFARAL
uniref:Uncharacterized protein n=1 Tax=Romanomermis culicivorax TaxID=13658 RepID=A0A915IBM1_ROMCU